MLKEDSCLLNSCGRFTASCTSPHCGSLAINQALDSSEVLKTFSLLPRNNFKTYICFIQWTHDHGGTCLQPGPPSTQEGGDRNHDFKPSLNIMEPWWELREGRVRGDNKGSLNWISHAHWVPFRYIATLGTLVSSTGRRHFSVWSPSSPSYMSIPLPRSLNVCPWKWELSLFPLPTFCRHASKSWNVCTSRLQTFKH